MSKALYFEHYRKCGCVAESVARKKDLPGYCPTHGNDRSYVYMELQLGEVDDTARFRLDEEVEVNDTNLQR